MLPKPRRPREKRIVELTRVTYTIAEFCEMTGLNRAAVLRGIDKGLIARREGRYPSMDSLRRR